MTAKRLAAALLISGCVSGQAASERDETQGMSTMDVCADFDRATISIAAKIKMLEVPDELFAVKPFMAVYENPLVHFPCALDFTRRRDMSTHQKSIVAYAMQRLPPDRLVTFLSVIADGVESRTTDPYVLEAAAFPPFNWGRQSVILHHESPEMRALLIRLMNLDRLPESRKAYIRNEILTGRARQDFLDDLDATGRALPR